ncbi:MAG: NUDIX domain-containing protein [Nanoarchaeales archaeon]|nr:NUDIX domain-containing protein [Nanoarchaeales archaeon]
MADELIKIYDENNTYSGKNLMKSVAHKEGLWHRTVHICIYNSKGQILLQKRAARKELLPDMWDISVAGHINSKQTELDAAICEISEEIGIDVKESDLDFFKIYKFAGTYRNIINNEFFYFYFLKLDLDTNSLVLQESEVADAQWFEPSRVLDNSIDNLVQQIYWLEIINKIKSLQ